MRKTEVEKMTTTVHARLPIYLHNRLHQESIETGKPISKILRQKLEEGFKLN
jgi:predicted DNA-binding protein